MRRSVWHSPARTWSGGHSVSEWETLRVGRFEWEALR
jgi:hypothetical protein